MSEFEAQARRLVDWCRRDALPLWASRGVAPDGGFYERLTPAGEGDAQARRRYRVQCRQVFVFAEAARRGWLEGARDIVAGGVDFIFSRTGWTPFEGAPLVLAPDGGVADPKVDLYTHAFLLLALASAVRIDHRAAEAVEKADAVIAFFDAQMASPHGGWIESVPPALPRRQNPHMHLFEAFLALFEATGEARFRARADQMAALFDAHFHRTDQGVLLEFFEDDWAPHAARGHIAEPGHLMEWAWLLDRHARAGGADRGETILTLYDTARRAGADPATGFLIDEITADGAPLTAKRRSWAQTEYIKAALVAHRRGRADGQAVAAGVIEALLGSYLSADAPIPGGWTDRYDEAGAPMNDLNSASTFYHHMGAVLEVADAAGL